jgi:hypothetical protein
MRRLYSFHRFSANPEKLASLQASRSSSFNAIQRLPFQTKRFIFRPASRTYFFREIDVHKFGNPGRWSRRGDGPDALQTAQE